MTALPHLLTALAAFVAIMFLLYRCAVDCVRQAQEDEALQSSTTRSTTATSCTSTDAGQKRRGRSSR